MQPSWVPYWRKLEDNSTRPYDLRDLFEADCGLPLDIGAVLDNRYENRLTLVGYWFGTVSDVSVVASRSVLENAQQTLETVQTFQTLLETKAVHVGPLDMGATLIACTNEARLRATKDECAMLPAWLKYLEEHGDTPLLWRDLLASGETCDPIMLQLSAYQEAVRKALNSRRCFVTNSAFIGLGPASMGPGDIVAILHGCTWPVILRPHGERYKILGTCYTHGAMDGEIVRERQAQDVQPQTFIVV